VGPCAAVVDSGADPRSESYDYRTVVQEGTRAPLSSAQILVKGTTTGTMSRDNGTFSLQVPSGAVTLTVRRIGHPQTEVNVAASASTVDIVLRATSSSSMKSSSLVRRPASRDATLPRPSRVSAQRR
jgi:hypothetical protein